MKKILNTMQHALTSEQETDLGGMFGKHQLQDLRDVNFELFKQLSNIAIDSNLNDLANCLLEVARKFDIVILPIGSPAFMFTFSRLTHFHRDIVFMFAHSDRVSVEKQNEDGTVTKTNIFKHVKFLVM
ncbi:MAG: hypothetical protein M0P09_06175 [Acholeplasmataceae bacterium]|nr:hypothetical protein [Acholeplasmataceae bacterium]